MKTSAVPIQWYSYFHPSPYIQELHMRIRTKLLGGFGLLLALMVGVAITADWQVRIINATLSEITDINAVKQRQAINFRGSVHDRAIAFRDLVLLDDRGQLQATLTHISQLTAMYDEAARELDGIFASSDGHPEELQLLQAIKAVEQRTLPMLTRVRADYDAGNRAAATQVLIRDASPAFTAWLAAINQFIDWQERKSQLETDATRKVADNFTRLMLIICIIGLLAGGLLGWATITGIIRAVRGIDVGSARMAEGDLTARIDYGNRDELAHIATSFNRMGERFQGVVSQLAEATNQLAIAAEDTSAISSQTSGHLHQQQLETNQLATAINQMSVTVNEVASNTAGAAHKAQEASREAETGRTVVSGTIEVIQGLAGQIDGAAGIIEQLEEHSGRIGSVLSVIGGFAEQTNLLALNAAIEAARAGDHGRGFAVVADEVRKLASHTHDSAVEIRAVIEQLQKAAGEAVVAMDSSRGMASSGVEQVTQAGAALDNITHAVTVISDLSGQIATAAEEQSAATEEINRNITNISQMSEHNSDGARKTAGASEELTRLVERLQGLVSQFRT